VCLPLAAGQSADLIERLIALTEDTELRHADKVLRITELLTSGKGSLPRGRELEHLAGRCGVSRAEAYRSLPPALTTK